MNGFCKNVTSSASPRGSRLPLAVAFLGGVAFGRGSSEPSRVVETPQSEADRGVLRLAAVSAAHWIRTESGGKPGLGDQDGLPAYPLDGTLRTVALLDE